MSDSEENFGESGECPEEQTREADSVAGPDRAVQIPSEMEQLFSLLPALERTVLELRLGFHDGSPRTWQEISEHLDLGLEDMHKINASGLRRLYEPTRELWRRST